MTIYSLDVLQVMLSQYQRLHHSFCTQFSNPKPCSVATWATGMEGAAREARVPWVSKAASTSSELEWLWGRMDPCIYMAESPHCPLETTTTLLIVYTPTQNKKLKKRTLSDCSPQSSPLQKLAAQLSANLTQPRRGSSQLWASPPRCPPRHPWGLLAASRPWTSPSGWKKWWWWRIPRQCSRCPRDHLGQRRMDTIREGRWGLRRAQGNTRQAVTLAADPAPWRHPARVRRLDSPSPRLLFTRSFHPEVSHFEILSVNTFKTSISRSFSEGFSKASSLERSTLSLKHCKAAWWCQDRPWLSLDNARLRAMQSREDHS